MATATTISGSGTTAISGTGTFAIALYGWLMLLGDSKTAIPNATWPALLQGTLGARTPPRVWQLTSVGVSGATVLSASLAVTTLFAALPPNPPAATEVKVLMNWGVNEMGSLPAEATWEANYQILIDAAHAKWPAAAVYLMRPWMQGKDTESDTLATRIGHLIAANPSYVFLGPDERIFLKGSDNGVSETSDGVHPNGLGATLTAAAWAAVL